MASALCVRFIDLLDWLYGCAHRRTTLPVTLPVSIGGDGARSTQAETYVVCLECGQHVPYDWTEMRIRRRWGRLTRTSLAIPLLVLIGFTPDAHAQELHATVRDRNGHHAEWRVPLPCRIRQDRWFRA